MDGSSGSPQIFNPESQGNESMCTEWTDEKHSLYLKSMEASFVEQLYDSLDLHGSHSQNDCSSEPKSSRQMHVGTRIHSGQFKVHRDGSWAKINFRRGESASNGAGESNELSANQWIRHFRSGNRHQYSTDPSVRAKAALATRNQFPVSQPQLARQDPVDSHMEVTDQNFSDEDLEKKVAGHTCSIKKMNTSAVASSSNDQVVPFREFSTIEDGKR